MDYDQSSLVLTESLNTATISNDYSTALIMGAIVGWFAHSLIMGFVASAIASYNERRQAHAFFAGFFFGAIGVAAYMIMGESVELRVRLEQKALKKLK